MRALAILQVLTAPFLISKAKSCMVVAHEGRYGDHKAIIATYFSPGMVWHRSRTTSKIYKIRFTFPRVFFLKNIHTLTHYYMLTKSLLKPTILFGNS